MMPPEVLQPTALVDGGRATGHSWAGPLTVDEEGVGTGKSRCRLVSGARRSVVSLKVVIGTNPILSLFLGAVWVGQGI